MKNAYDVLKERGFIEQVSSEEGLRAALEQPLTCYVGYDPSAASLHVGHLCTIMALAHLQHHGHRPIVIVGGGTGMIGDPSGRTEMRQLLSEEQIGKNLAALQEQIGRFVDFTGGRALMRNNADWLRDLRYIDFLRDVGRHFSVNRMLAAESYRSRLEEGLSFLEFNYQLLQAYDFLHLYQEYGCRLQMGGNDQWGNILAGVDLIRRMDGGEAFALTLPLLTTASGAKMGKTAQGAVWLDAERLSPFDFYQFWVNVEDADVVRFLRIFTFLPLDEIERLGRLEGADVRQAKEILAYEVTRNTHGVEAAEAAKQSARELFGGGGLAADVPTTEIDEGLLQEGVPVAELFQLAGLVRSRSEARRLIEQGGAYLNEDPGETIDRLVTAGDLRDGSVLLRAGKKRYRRVIIAG
jgi:tyrosyl-tRNA synthetase